MPTYEYECPMNQRVIEVQHKMSEQLKTWGELCERAGITPGPTDLAAPVQKLMSAGFIATGASGAAEPALCDLPACASGPCGHCAS